MINLPLTHSHLNVTIEDKNPMLIMHKRKKEIEVEYEDGYEFHSESFHRLRAHNVHPVCAGYTLGYVAANGL